MGNILILCLVGCIEYTACNMIQCRLEHTVMRKSCCCRFANKGIIQQYTLLVNTYSTNNDETNLAVFTMLSHICIECERRDLLYTPILLRQLRLLSDSCEACDEDRRLAFYVTQSFLDDVANRPQVSISSTKCKDLYIPFHAVRFGLRMYVTQLSGIVYSFRLASRVSSILSQQPKMKIQSQVE